MLLLTIIYQKGFLPMELVIPYTNQKLLVLVVFNLLPQITVMHLPIF